MPVVPARLRLIVFPAISLFDRQPYPLALRRVVCRGPVMKHIAICFVSAAAGTIFGTWLISGGSSLPLAAGQSGSQQSVLPVPRTAEFSNGSAGEPRTKPRAYLADGLTPDEATSAYVYDLANRSVVNIATRIGSERTFFRQNRTEDAGSGFVLDTDGHIPDELSRDRRSAANPGDAVQRKILRCGTSWCRPHQRYRRHQTRRSPGVTESSNDWRFQRAESWE